MTGHELRGLINQNMQRAAYWQTYRQLENGGNMADIAPYEQQYGNAALPAQQQGLLDANYGGRDVLIRKVSNGFYVKVGCQRFVFMKFQELAEALELYTSDPAAAEKKYVNGGK